ncbi:MAG: transposase [Kiritimatiellaeota bacterium]|nr:transposase [Kiritimatiellota bacterium]
MVTVLDRSTGKYSRHSCGGRSKEFDRYKKISELVSTGRPVSVCYEAGRSGFTPARHFNSLGCDTRILPVNKIEIISSGKKVKTDKIDDQFLSEINPLDKSVPSVRAPSVHQECLRELPREEQRIKRDIKRNNNRIISIPQRWPIPNVSNHNDAEDWRGIIREWSKADAISKLPPVSELNRIEMMVDELELPERHLKGWREVMRTEEEAERRK